MSDIPVYMIANFHIQDADTYKLYEKGFFPLLKKHGGSFLSYDDSTVTLEGAYPREGRIVLFQLPSETAAQAWLAIQSIKRLQSTVVQVQTRSS